MLLNHYFYIDQQSGNVDETLFHVSLNPNHAVYQGHFPNNPIAPGVCNIQMLKECLEKLLHCPLFLCQVKQCRFLSVITPLQQQQLQIKMQVQQSEMTAKMSATVFDNTTVYIEFKGEFTKQPL
ncbi:MAG: hydroxymyristoyl-ACP dehydratase [Bacteroidales bacterium]|nr:hydroxymyristoyl-ACP dehydratase [Bacteroidales bacterium]